MITFNYEIEFKLEREIDISEWITQVIKMEERDLGEINYVFCNDAYLHKLNSKYLNHNTYTDVISFDYSVGKRLHGDIYISVDRVEENAAVYDEKPEAELNRVMIHGILHYCGYNDKTPLEKSLMREKENFYLAKLH